MSDQDPSVAATIAATESSAGGRWGVWLSDTGWWWTARTRTLTARELGAGCLPYIHDDSLQELAARIREQDSLCQQLSRGGTLGSGLRQD